MVHGGHATHISAPGERESSCVMLSNEGAHGRQTSFSQCIHVVHGFLVLVDPPQLGFSAAEELRVVPILDISRMVESHGRDAFLDVEFVEETI